MKLLKTTPKIVFAFLTIFLLFKLGICSDILTAINVLIWMFIASMMLIYGMIEALVNFKMVRSVEATLDPFRDLLESVQGLKKEKNCTFMEAVQFIKDKNGGDFPDWIIEVLKRKDTENNDEEQRAEN